MYIIILYPNSNRPCIETGRAGIMKEFDSYDDAAKFAERNDLDYYAIYQKVEE